MPAVIFPGDRSWCEKAALSLLAGSSVPGGVTYPGIVPGLNGWTPSAGIKPEDSITGSIVPRATAFTVRMPSPTQLAPYFSRTPGAKGRMEAYLEATVLHELVHFRQARAIATILPMTPTATDYLAYYTNPFELEAHGAQIALGLRSKPLPIGIDEIFRTQVGMRIDGRIHSLSWSLSLGAAYAGLRHALAVEVNHCLTLLR